MLAEEANLGKTRFLAAAGHDILQPLNAARLYCASLIEKAGSGAGRRGGAQHRIVARIGRDDPRRRARHLAPRRRRAEARRDRVPARRAAAPDRHRLPAAGARQGARPRHRAVLADGRDRPQPVSPPGAEPRLQRDQVHAQRPRPGRRAGGAATSPSCRSSTPASAFPIDKLQHVFGEFTRLDAGMREAEGLGLGLSIVDRIARVLRLELQIDSGRGKGTPLLGHPAGVAGAEPALPRRSRAPQHAGRGRSTASSVLCVDNDARILDGMRAAARGLGLHGDHRVGIGATCRRCGSRPVDIVLADYHLDGETGLDVIAALRAALGRSPAGRPDHRRPFERGAQPRRTCSTSRSSTSRSSPQCCAR